MKYHREVEIADFMLKYPDKKNIELVSIFVKKFGKDARSINRYIREAKKINLNRLQKQESAKVEELAAEAKEAMKNAIATRTQTLEAVSRILMGKERKVQDEVLVPSDGDILRAASFLTDTMCWQVDPKVQLDNEYAALEDLLKRSPTIAVDMIAKRVIELQKLSKENRWEAGALGF